MKTRIFALLASVLLAGCAAPGGPVNRTDELPFDQAADIAADALTSQINQLPGFLAKVESALAKKPVVVDNTIDSVALQQTQLTKRLDDRLAERLGRPDSPFQVLPFQPANIAKATYLITGTIKRAVGAKSAFQINLALTDLKTGNVVAQASSRARDDGFNLTPSAYYVDSPIVLSDNRINGQILTSTTPPGNPTNRAYLEQVAVAPLLAEAKELYNNRKYDEALNIYLKIPLLPNADQLEVFTGLYLTYMKKSLPNNAEPYFGRMVALGIKNNSLSVKFLFDPGKIEFVQDPVNSVQYALWLRQIARQVAAAKACMNIVGHTSHTGSAEFNDRLSEARAKEVARKLAEITPELNGRMKMTGVGFRQNLSGKGTDDREDMVDRRVEFKLDKCV